VAERTVVGLADLAEYSDRRRWANRTLVLAAVTGSLMLMLWLEAAEPDLAGPIGCALLLCGFTIAVSAYGGRRFNVIPTGVTRLAAAPKPILDALIELAVVREELTALLSNSWSLEDPTDLLIRTRSWLTGLGQLPASSREWLARREASAAGIHAELRRVLASSEAQRRGTLQLLRRAIVEFEQACEREELCFDPYRGTLQHAPEGVRVRKRERSELAAEVQRAVTRIRAQVVVFVVALLCLAAAGSRGLARWSEHLFSNFDWSSLLLVFIAFMPIGMWLITLVLDRSSQTELARLIGAGASVTGVRARRRAALERLTTLALVVAVLAISFGIPMVVLERWAEDRVVRFMLQYDDQVRLLLVGPSASVIAAVLVTRVRPIAQRFVAGRRAARLEIMVEAGQAFALADIVRARGVLSSAWLPEQPELLRAIASGLACAAELPDAQRTSLARAGFDARPALALLRPALARGGIMTRGELLALDLEVRELERALCRASPFI
jgi:hypothetical protein